MTTVAGTPVVRVLPTRTRRAVGPWCFVDCMTPADFDDPHPLEVGPHPHTGLATVTWLFEGEALHCDSLGTEQLIRPGQLNLMTAGRGIAHAELGVAGRIRGVQMWLAQPEGTRDGRSRFEHHDDLPRVEFHAAVGTVLVGDIGGASSSAMTDTSALGLDLLTRRGASELDVDRRFEHALVPIDASIRVCGEVIAPGWMAVIPRGNEAISIEAAGAGRVMVFGGVPLEDRIQMWWNFVARTKEELAAAWLDWQDGNTDRFGQVPSKLERIDAPRPPWLPAPR